MKTVFISHADKDAQCAVDLENVMRPGGFRAWRFQSDMVGGRPWRPQLPSNLESSDIFLLATTAHALDSDICEKEWQHAALIQKPVVTVVFERGVHPPSPLSDHQWVHFDGSDESGAKLIIALQNAEPLQWEKIPSDWRTWDGKTKSDLATSIAVERNIPLPRMRRDLTDLEKQDFLISAMKEIRVYFDRALCAFEGAESRISTRISDKSDSDFVCQLYLDGELKKACRIYVSTIFNGVAYYEAHGHSARYLSKGESYNVLATVSLRNGVPALEFVDSFMIGDPSDSRLCTVGESAERLWRDFTRDFDHQDSIW